MLGKEAVTYSTVTKYAENARFALTTEAIPPKPAEGGHGPVDEAILAAIGEKPFSSGRELSRLTCLPRSTVHRRLAQSLRFPVRHLRLVPGFLPAEQKRTRVDMAGELLRVLSGQVTHQCHDIVTLDESWVYVYTEHEMMWVSPGETVPDKEGQSIQAPELMLTVLWNASRFHVVKSLSKGTKFNAQYSVNNILIGISDWPRETGGTRPKKAWVHTDNARPRTAKVSIDFLAFNDMK
jgi:hypothetical protein